MVLFFWGVVDDFSFKTGSYFRFGLCLFALHHRTSLSQVSTEMDQNTIWPRRNLACNIFPVRTSNQTPPVPVCVSFFIIYLFFVWLCYAPKRAHVVYKDIHSENTKKRNMHENTRPDPTIDAGHIKDCRLWAGAVQSQHRPHAHAHAHTSQTFQCTGAYVIQTDGRYLLCLALPKQTSPTGSLSSLARCQADCVSLLRPTQGRRRHWVLFE